MLWLQVLEYTLFQPGWFVNYFTHPYKSTKHIQPLQTPIDFCNRRLLMVDGSDDVRITLTTAEDLAKVVARAIEYEGEWPVVSGIKGDEFTIKQLIELGERVRGESQRFSLMNPVLTLGSLPGTGKPFRVERLKADDLKAGVVKSSWLPKADHHSFTPEEATALAENVTAGILLGISAGALNVSDEWNKLLPDYKFTKAEDFLTEAWRGKP
jgi:hypothetical protein